MNELMTQFGMTEYNGVPVVSSVKVAEEFGKRHDNVLQSIREAINNTQEFDPNFSGANFIESRYKVRGKWYPEYLLTKNGFYYTVFGFNGKKAAQVRVDYIERFDRMEQFIKSLYAAKMEFPEFTQAIMLAHEEPKHYHFSNEVNMINKIVLGMTAKQFKVEHGLDDVSTIRPYLTQPQIVGIERLQKFDTGLIYTEPDYQKRKIILTDYHEKVSSIRVIGKSAVV